jgi:hypothetical protein
MRQKLSFAGRASARVRRRPHVTGQPALFSFGARAALLLVGGLLALVSSACAPKLGDGCKQGIDCDVRNQRICDRSQPGGYCTIANCKPGDCGDEGVCVRFRPDEPRLSTTFCMAKCDNTADCDRDAYVCRNAESVNLKHDPTGDTALVEVLDGRGGAKFCTTKD